MALSYIYRVVNQTRATYISVGSLEKILKNVFYTDSNAFLGPRFRQSFKSTLPSLAEHGYIRWENDMGKYRISNELIAVFDKVAEDIPGDEVVHHRARCDYLKRKISPFRPTYAMVLDELNRSKEDNRRLKARYGEGSANREIGIQTLAEEDIDMDDHDNSVGGSIPASFSTPRRCHQLSVPELAYPTPESLHRQRTAREIEPLSPLSRRASSISERVFSPSPDLVDLNQEQDIELLYEKGRNNLHREWERRYTDLDKRVGASHLYTFAHHREAQKRGQSERQELENIIEKLRKRVKDISNELEEQRAICRQLRVEDESTLPSLIEASIRRMNKWNELEAHLLLGVDRHDATIEQQAYTNV
ncbi:hypothetical protein H0H93_013758 [Arthromyces matolae]|nr:hypothetical protein H0H93_013758 [Arthromyces matolae]